MTCKSVDVRTSSYELSHGKRPRGFGSWAFGLGERDPELEDIFWVHQKHYTPAMYQAVEEARRRGIHEVWVLS